MADTESTSVFNGVISASNERTELKQTRLNYKSKGIQLYDAYLIESPFNSIATEKRMQFPTICGTFKIYSHLFGLTKERDLCEEDDNTHYVL